MSAEFKRTITNNYINSSKIAEIWECKWQVWSVNQCFAYYRHMPQAYEYQIRSPAVQDESSKISNSPCDMGKILMDQVPWTAEGVKRPIRVIDPLKSLSSPYRRDCLIYLSSRRSQHMILFIIRTLVAYVCNMLIYSCKYYFVANVGTYHFQAILQINKTMII